MKKTIGPWAAALIVMLFASCASNRSGGTAGTTGGTAATGTGAAAAAAAPGGAMPMMAGAAGNMQMPAAVVYRTGAAKIYENVKYAAVSASEVCDIYIPAGAGPFPVLSLVHGGGFAFESQRMALMSSVAVKAVDSGYAVIAIDYRKSNEAVFPAALSDVKGAIRFIKANAAKYGFDRDRVAVWGESAGAYLSVMTALTPDAANLNGDVNDNLDQSSSVKAVVDFYGPIEFYTMDAEYAALGISGTSYSKETSFESKFLGQAIGRDKTAAYKTYWETYKDQLPAGFRLAAWIQAGTGDKNVPYTQSRNLAARLSAIIGTDTVHFGLMDGAAHMDSVFYSDRNLNDIFSFLKKSL